MKKVLMTAVAAGVPRLAFACPVCFGQSDSPMASAMNLGIMAMLVVVVGMLASFAAFFVYLNRRARLAADGTIHSSPTRPLGPRTDAQEGTA